TRSKRDWSSDVCSSDLLARKLVVYPTTLYWHAGTKAQLLALVSQRVLEEIDLPDEADYDWQQWMLILGKRVRKVLGAHPRFAARSEERRVGKEGRCQ